MYQPTTQLNWPTELQALAHDPDSEAAITGFQGQLARYPDTHPTSVSRLAQSRGLVWSTGTRVPACSMYEHTVTTIPLISLMKTDHQVTAAFGRCLADPAGQQAAFLLACVQKAGLHEPQAMLRAMPTERQPEAVNALFGDVNPEAALPLIIALPSA
jgi:hypothetical protein